jgi:hypothetical protein
MLRAGIIAHATAPLCSCASTRCVIARRDTLSARFSAHSDHIGARASRGALSMRALVRRAGTVDARAARDCIAVHHVQRITALYASCASCCAARRVQCNRACPSGSGHEWRPRVACAACSLRAARRHAPSHAPPPPSSPLTPPSPSASAPSDASLTRTARACNDVRGARCARGLRSPSAHSALHTARAAAAARCLDVCSPRTHDRCGAWLAASARPRSDQYISRRQFELACVKARGLPL